MMNSGRWFVLLAAAAVVPLAERPVFADDERKAEASQFFTQGLELVDQGRFEAALEAFKAAYALSPHPTVLYNLGQAALAAGRRKQALEYFERYLRDSAGNDSPDQSRRRTVEQAVAQLRLEFPPAQPPTPVPDVGIQDGSPVTAVPAAASRPNRWGRRLALIGAALGVGLLASAGASHLWNGGRHDDWEATAAAHRSLGPPQTPSEMTTREASARQLNRQLEGITRVDKINLAMAASGTALTVVAGAVWWLGRSDDSPELAIALGDGTVTSRVVVRW
jgi:tetratricopeptide (TPR) repeat protein